MKGFTDSEIAELQEKIEAGSAPECDVARTALILISYASYMAADFNIDSIEEMSSDQARAALDRVQGGRTYLQGVLPIFDKYPLVSTTMHNLIRSMLYAESALIPFFMLSNRDVASGRPCAETYIARHPITNLIKIGRSADVCARMKSLETGAGSPIELIAVIDHDCEAELHKRFADLRRHGEWFEDIDGQIVAFCKSIGVQVGGEA